MPNFQWIADFLGIGEFLPSNGFMNWISGLFCDAAWIQGVCESVLFLLTGFDPAQMNETLLPTIVSHTPAGASTHTILHYGQEVTSGDFAAYDHGKDNLDIYGTIDPPLYLPQKVTVPISLYWSLNDWMAAPTVSAISA